MRIRSVHALAVGAALLAIEPLLWLVQTWVQPAYDSYGWLPASLAVALFIRSGLSPRRGPSSTTALPWVLLAMTAIVRICGQAFAIHVLSACALVIDVYALGRIAGLQRRTFAVAPAWLALVFALALPAEQVVQRTIGYPLQYVSAKLAGGLLSLGIEDVRSEGVRIVLDGQDILVDLPCSGARGLLLVLLCFFATAALTRPAPARAAVGLVVTLAAAGMTNAARIAGLALGIARPAYVGGIDVMEAPWHDVIGVVALGVGLAVVLAWGRSIPPRARTSDNRSYRAAPSNTPVESWRSWLLAATVLGAALALPTIPAHPLDVAAPADPPALPNRILAHGRVDIAPQPHEREYFATYGGGISKASFGPLGLMTVRTSAPLRHLHDPDVCARAAGHAVRYLGLVSPVTAAYRATSPTGEHHRIHVTYVSDTGYIASNVATTVWHWMHGRVRTWTLIQRSYPETLAERERLRLDAAVLALFDIDNHRVQHP